MERDQRRAEQERLECVKRHQHPAAPKAVVYFRQPWATETSRSAASVFFGMPTIPVELNGERARVDNTVIQIQVGALPLLNRLRSAA